MIRNRTAKALIFISFALLSAPVLAQDVVQDIPVQTSVQTVPAAPVATPAIPAQPQDFMGAVVSLNMTQPEHNPRYKPPTWFINRSVVDSAREVIGEADDLLIDNNGVVRQIVAGVNVPGNGRQTLYLDTNNVIFQDISHVFQIPQNKQELADNLPIYLNAVGTAAGSQGDIFSLKRAVQADVRDGSGRPYAKVAAVLLNETGSKIEALVLTNITGTRGFQRVGIPYDGTKVTTGEDFGRLTFYIAAPYDKQITDYVVDKLQ
jgi:hypothetical protein